MGCATNRWVHRRFAAYPFITYFIWQSSSGAPTPCLKCGHRLPMENRPWAPVSHKKRHTKLQSRRQPRKRQRGGSSASALLRVSKNGGTRSRCWRVRPTSSITPAPPPRPFRSVRTAVCASVCSVIRLVMQFMQENGLHSSLRALQVRSLLPCCLAALPCCPACLATLSIWRQM